MKMIATVRYKTKNRQDASRSRCHKAESFNSTLEGMIQRYFLNDAANVEKNRRRNQILGRRESRDIGLDVGQNTQSTVPVGGDAKNNVRRLKSNHTRT